MKKISVPKKKDLFPYIFAFWFATNIFESVNLSSIAGIPTASLQQVQAILTLGRLVPGLHQA